MHWKKEDPSGRQQESPDAGTYVLPAGMENLQTLISRIR
jgi:hypothetical protein